MRQVRADELLYHLFQSTHGWSDSLRNDLAADSAERRHRGVTIGSAVVAENLRYFLVFPDGEPAPLNPKELAAVFAQSIAGWRRTLQKDYAAREERIRTAARWTAALVMYDDLAGFQILTDMVEPAPFRLPGDAGSGVPTSNDYPMPGRLSLVEAVAPRRVRAGRSARLAPYASGT